MAKHKRERILGQDKDINGKLTQQNVTDVVGKFKEQYADRHENPNQSLIGFELDGGDGMTKGGKKVWDDFANKWCSERGLKAIYNTKEEAHNIKNNLRNSVDNKIKNK